LWRFSKNIEKLLKRSYKIPKLINKNQWKREELVSELIEIFFFNKRKSRESKNFSSSSQRHLKEKIFIRNLRRLTLE